MTPEAALIAFVTDLTGDNTALIDRTREVLAEPPEATPQAMGFYPLGGETPFERSFRRTISDLESDGIIRGYEDKYVDEMLAEWLAPTVTALLSPEPIGARIGGRTRLFAERLAAGEVGANLSIDLIAAAREIEAALAADDRALLSVDLDGGDTLFAFVMRRPAAARWREVCFVKRHDGARLAVRRFQWDLFAHWLGYALRDDDLEISLPEDLTPRPLRSLDDVAEP